MKKLKIFLLIFASSLLAMSCSDDDTSSLDAKKEYIVGFNQSATTSIIVTDGEVKSLNYPVGIIGGAQGLQVDSDVNITYELDPSSTAVEGVEFDFVSTSHVVTVENGNFSTLIPINVYSNNIVVGDNKKIVLNLTAVDGNGNTVIGSNHKQITILLKGACYSNLAGNYVVNYTSGTFPVLVTEVSPGLYKSTVTPGFTQYDMYFSDICGVLTITDWEFNLDYPISGSGAVQSNGDLRFTGVTVQGIYSNRNYTFVKQ